MSGSSLMKVLPHSFPGSLSQQNQTALDWGWQNLIAYGSNNLVVVVDPRTVQCLQTLSHHKCPVVKVRWSLGRYHRSMAAPYRLRLASVDSTSQCAIWDVSQGVVLKELNLGSKPLVDLQWLETNDSCSDLLAVMLPPGVMTIWNTKEGIRMSRFTFSDTILAFTFNPFQPETLILQSSECFIFVEDFHPSRTPNSGGRKHYLTYEDSAASSMRNKCDNHLRAQHRLVTPDELQGKETKPLSDCLQMCFSPACRYRLFLVYSREILILDTDLKQTVGAITSERNSSPFHQILPCRQRDLLYCLHENGCVSVRVHQRLSFPSALPTSSTLSSHQTVRYDLYAHSEALRISKTCQVFMAALCPSSERHVGVLTSEGRVLIWQLEFCEVGTSCGGSVVQDPDCMEADNAMATVMSSRPVKGVGLGLALGEEGEKSDMEEDFEMWQVGKLGWSLADAIAPHWFTPPSGYEYALLTVKLTLTQLWVGLPASTSCLRMCPPLTTKNWLYYAPLVAMGMTNGSILVYNLHSRHIMKELAIHNFPVRGVEWIHQNSFISYASSQPSSSTSTVRNEIAVINIQNGSVTFLKRPDTPDDAPSTAIDTIKISPLKHYLVVKYKDKPLEFWDLKTVTFLREMVSNPPSFSCIEWTPSHRSKSKADHTVPNNTVDFDMAMGADTKMAQALSKEYLTVMDSYGSMWQITIEGSKVKVVNSTPTQTNLLSPSCVTWKNTFMAAGDAEGNLYFHDGKISKTIENPRVGVRKIRFAPGKGNSKILVLFTTRLEIRDTTSDSVISSLRWGPKENGQVVVEDADWAASDKAVVAASDGSVRVYDLSFQLCQSAFTLADFRDSVFCPHGGPASAALRLKTLLTHQPWRSDYSLLCGDHEDGQEDGEDQAFTGQLKLLPDEWCDMLLDAHLGTPQRALHAARIFGDKYEVEFWSLSVYYILREKFRLHHPKYEMYKSSQPRNPTSDFIRPDSLASVSLSSKDRQKEENLLLGPFSPSSTSDSGDMAADEDLTDGEVAAMLQDSDLQTLSSGPPLDLSWDLLCDRDIFRKVQLSRVAHLDSRRTTSSQAKRCSELLLLLGQTDRSVQLLLETDSSSPDYYNCALKACLAATIRSSGVSQSTIKLVATNLIANTRLMDGVELLCLIDKQQDACRYLQTYGEWYHSVWLAKATLCERDCNDVLSKWVEYLTSVGVDQKTRGVLVMLSLGQFWKVVEMLYSMEYYDQAAIFLESCLEHQVLQRSRETTTLAHNVYLEYARHLLAIGHVPAFKHYCSKAGLKGEQLLENYFKQSSSKSSILSPTSSSSPSAHSLLVDLVT